MATSTCEECGAERPEGRTCADDFDALLAWEHARPALREQHHLAVLTYHLQHPHLYSPEGLAHARRLLEDFIVGATPTVTRARARAALGTDRRRLTGTVASHGSYAVRPQWPVTVADVVGEGVDGAAEAVGRWARTAHTAITRASNG